MKNMKEIKETKYATKNYESLFGIILMLLGLSFILDNLWWFNLLWQIALIIWGTLNIKEGNTIYGIILIAFGSLFIVDWAIMIDIRDILIGLFFIALGGKMLFSNLR
ncbi:MAG: LiaF transmembrane domain-containing protein [Mycoplasmatales bacterium]